MDENEMTYDEFKELYYDRVSKSGSARRAYVEAEQIHKERFNKSKYSSIESFRVQLSKNRR